MTMDREKAEKILKDCIQPNYGLYNVGWYIDWFLKQPNKVCLDGNFTMEELEAIVWWMRNNQPTGEDNENIG